MSQGTTPERQHGTDLLVFTLTAPPNTALGEVQLAIHHGLAVPHVVWSEVFQHLDDGRLQVTCTCAGSSQAKVGEIRWALGGLAAAVEFSGFLSTSVYYALPQPHPQPPFSGLGIVHPPF
jgi:hypothetical protein